MTGPFLAEVPVLERNGETQQLQWSEVRTGLNLEVWLLLALSLLLVRDVQDIRAVRNLIASRGEMIVRHSPHHLLVTGGPHPHHGRAGASLQSVMSKDLTVIAILAIIFWNNRITYRDNKFRVSTLHLSLYNNICI